MNIYDKKIIKCTKCNKSIGEIDYDAEIVYPQCGDCADPKPHYSDYQKIRYGRFPLDVISIKN